MAKLNWMVPEKSLSVIEQMLWASLICVDPVLPLRLTKKVSVGSASVSGRIGTVKVLVAVLAGKVSTPEVAV